MELRAPERPVGDASRRGMADRPTLIFATGPAPLLGALATALLAYRGGWKLSAIACRAEKGKPADRPFECEAEA